MLRLLAVSLIGLLLFRVVRHILLLQHTVREAKKIGFPVVATPVNILNIFWLITHKLWIPFIERLPKSWTESWLR
jgi:hypothetical protein